MKSQSIQTFTSGAGEPETCLRRSDAPRICTRPRLLLFGQDDAQPLKVLCAAGHQEPRLRLWTKLPPLFFFYSRFGRGKKNPRRHFGDKKAISATWLWCWRRSDLKQGGSQSGQDDRGLSSRDSDKFRFHFQGASRKNLFSHQVDRWGP